MDTDRFGIANALFGDGSTFVASADYYNDKRRHVPSIDTMV